MPPTLYLIATPIGNLEDITLRALRILRDEVAAIACEDTRQSQKLLDHFDIRKPLISYHEHNEASRSAELVERMSRGESIALISDAGTPLVSDPGYRLVSAAINQGVPVVPLPGPSAALAALAASGLPTDEFRFVGFLPAKSGARKRFFEDLQTEQATVIAYESPHRIVESMADMASVLPERRVAIARELTKLHEEFIRGSSSDVHRELAARPSVKGEITVVIGRPEKSESAGDPIAEIQRLQTEERIPRMDALKSVAKRWGLPKRELYRLLEEQDNK